MNGVTDLDGMMGLDGVAELDGMMGMTGVGGELLDGTELGVLSDDSDSALLIHLMTDFSGLTKWTPRGGLQM